MVDKKARRVFTVTARVPRSTECRQARTEESVADIQKPVRTFAAHLHARRVRSVRTTKAAAAPD
jgi:hypothetical protein